MKSRKTFLCTASLSNLNKLQGVQWGWAGKRSASPLLGRFELSAAAWVKCEVPLWLAVWQVYNPRPRLGKAQGAELKLGDSCRNWKPVSLNLDPLKSQLVHSPPKTLFTNALSHCRLCHLSTGPNLTERCLYTCYNNT